MRATPLDEGRYFPLCLMSGRDAVTVDYGGTGLLSYSGHTHMEAHQTAPTGWYKTSATKPHTAIQPILIAGVQVMLFGAPAEPRFYEQEFFPERATVETVVSFRHGVKLKITAFFTYNTGIWCERVEVVEKREDVRLDLAFRLNNPMTGARACSFRKPHSVSFAQDGKDGVAVSYLQDGFTGRGVLRASRPFDRTRSAKQPEAYETFFEGIYDDLRAGDCLSRTLFLLGDEEKHIGFDELREIAEGGFDGLLSDHEALWRGYFRTSEVRLEGSPEHNYIYNLSRYVIKSCQSPDSGVITIGMMPYHWNGGIACNWDTEFVHEALLISGAFTESEHYTDQYIRSADICRRAVAEAGFPGIAFPGWTNLAGEFSGHRPLGEWLTTYKPLFNSYAIHGFYREWKENPALDPEKYRALAEGVAEFLLARLITEGEGGRYYVKEAKDSFETGVTVKLDSSLQITFAKAFLEVAEMYGNEKYARVGRGMLLALEENRREDGHLLSSKSLPYLYEYLAGYYSTYKLTDLDPTLVTEYIEGLATPWGTDSPNSSEEYRHWPWNDSWAARDYIRMKDARRAERHIAHMTYGASTLGALPEKIRMDGEPIGVWYTTPHALFVSALCEAAAAEGKTVDGVTELLLAYGLTEGGGTKAREINLGGVSVSLTVSDGTLTGVTLKNRTEAKRELTLDLNPLIKGELPRRVTLKPHEERVIL